MPRNERRAREQAYQWWLGRSLSWCEAFLSKVGSWLLAFPSTFYGVPLFDVENKVWQRGGGWLFKQRDRERDSSGQNRIFKRLTLSLPSSKGSFSQSFKEKCTSKAARIGNIIIFYLSKCYDKPSSSYCVMWSFWRNLVLITLATNRMIYELFIQLAPARFLAEIRPQLYNQDDKSKSPADKSMHLVARKN